MSQIFAPGNRCSCTWQRAASEPPRCRLCQTVAGVTTFGTASARKHQVLRDNGCTYPIDYRAVDYATEVRRLTDGRGVDIVLDPLGGRDTLKGYRLLREGGRIVNYGFANLQGPRFNPFRILGQLAGVPRFSPLRLMNENRGILGVNIGHLFGRADLLLGEMQALLALYEQGKIAPVIDCVLPLEGAPKVTSASHPAKTSARSSSPFCRSRRSGAREGRAPEY